MGSDSDNLTSADGSQPLLISGVSLEGFGRIEEEHMSI